MMGVFETMDKKKEAKNHIKQSLSLLNCLCFSDSSNLSLSALNILLST